MQLQKSAFDAASSKVSLLSMLGLVPFLISNGVILNAEFLTEGKGHIQWKSLESTWGEDQQFLFLIQESFLTQHVLEPTRGDNVLDIVLSLQKELVDNVKIHELLGNSDHNQIHFDINVKSESKDKKNV